MVEKKDYTASGVNLCNPPEVKDLIDQYREAEAKQAVLTAEMVALIPGRIRDGKKALSVELGEIEGRLREAIKEHGGYQDIDTETYALFSTRKTAEYHVGMFITAPDANGKSKYAKFIPLVVHDVIDPDALKGQIKGKLLTEAELVEDGVITYKESQAFILSLPEPKAD